MTVQIPKNTIETLDSLNAKVLFTRTKRNGTRVYLAAIIDKATETVYAQGEGDSEVLALEDAVSKAMKPGAKPKTPLEEIHALRAELAKLKGEEPPPPPVQAAPKPARHPTKGNRVNVAQIA